MISYLNYDYYATPGKKNSLCGATTMSNIQLEVSTASTLMCATPCKDEMESDLLAVSSQHSAATESDVGDGGEESPLV